MSKHSLEFNKVAAGFLLAGIIAMVCAFVADGLYEAKDAQKRGFAVAVQEEVAGSAPVAVIEIDIGTLLASADAVKGGESAQKKCTSCHTFEHGGADKVGPNLAGIVGSKIGGKEGFAYSDSVKAHGGTWGYEELNHWLKKPSQFIKGTKMSASISDDADRANIIAYLKSISPSAPAYPAPKPAAVPAATK
jgi:cytochrome c